MTEDVMKAGQGVDSRSRAGRRTLMPCTFLGDALPLAVMSAAALACSGPLQAQGPGVLPWPSPGPAAQSAAKEPEGTILFDYRSGSSPGGSRESGEPTDAERRRIVDAVAKAVVWEGL